MPADQPVLRPGHKANRAEGREGPQIRTSPGTPRLLRWQASPFGNNANPACLPTLDCRRAGFGSYFEAAPFREIVLERAVFASGKRMDLVGGSRFLLTGFGDRLFAGTRKPAAANKINSSLVASGLEGSHLPLESVLIRCGPVAV